MLLVVEHIKNAGGTGSPDRCRAAATRPTSSGLPRRVLPAAGKPGLQCNDVGASHDTQRESHVGRQAAFVVMRIVMRSREISSIPSGTSRHSTLTAAGIVPAANRSASRVSTKSAGLKTDWSICWARGCRPRTQRTSCIPEWRRSWRPSPATGRHRERSRRSLPPGGVSRSSI